jgi:acyl-CoA synthetase (AMP-forming)/AMP-acid ligase II
MASRPVGTLDDLLSASNGDVALRIPESDAPVTHAELAESIYLLAGRLHALGVRRGDRVALALPNGPAIVELLLAIMSLGAAAAPLNPAYTEDEYAFYLEDLAPRLLLLPVDEIAAARAARPAATHIVDVVSEGTQVELRDEGNPVRESSTFEPADSDDVALLLHTSGTTSRPKQVPLRHRNLMASATAIVEHYGLGPGDVSYCVMPLFHVHGLVASTLSTLAAGGTVIVPRQVSRRRFTEHLRAHRVTWFSAGPTLHHMLLEHGGDGATEFPDLRFIRSCSSALSAALCERAERHYGVPMLEAYGMTEASHQIASNPVPPGQRRLGSVGVPTGTRIRIVDKGRVVEDGQRGEVQIQGPGVTAGYLANDKANAESFVDGWFRTGDLGLIDGGYLRLLGRLKELIIRGGENVSPLEVEDILLLHPAVIDAACFGVPDEKYGEEVAAAVALREKSTERELIEHCRARLIDFKVPKTVYILDAIPRTPTGKLQRRRVASTLLDAQA